jgi:N-acetylneuraminic acid mutarotase
MNKLKSIALVFSLLASGWAFGQFVALPVWNQVASTYVYTGNWTWVHGPKYLGPAMTFPGNNKGVAQYQNVPGMRTSFATWTDGSDNLWLFGGIGYDSNYALGLLADLWKYEPTGCSGKGCWTWVSGPITRDQVGVYGTKGTPASGNYPGSRSLATTWYDGTYLWLFGGEGYDSAGGTKDLNDLWRYNISTNEWTWMSGSSTGNQFGAYGTIGVGSTSNYPGGRSATTKGWTTSGFLWFFGGQGRDDVSGINYLNDVWRFEISTGEWTWMKGSNLVSQNGTYGTKGTEASGNTPGARERMASFVDSSGNFWLFGGVGRDSIGSSSYLNDLWRYNVATNDWTWMSGANTVNQTAVPGTKGTAAAPNTPGALQDTTSWTDSSGAFWLFGGNGKDSAGNFGYLNSMWKFDTGTGWWTWVRGLSTKDKKGTYGDEKVGANANTPSSRWMANGWVTGGTKLWLFGGSGFDCCQTTWEQEMQDMWSFNTSNKRWQWERGMSDVNYWGDPGTTGVAKASNLPDLRDSPSCTFDSVNGNAWMFGGVSFGTYISDLWKFDPVAGWWTEMTGNTGYDSAGVFGTLGVPATGNYPSSREAAAVWADSSGHFWLFGGYGKDSAGNTGALNDLWSYDPTGCSGAGCWTWVAGSNTRDSSGTFGTKGTPSTSNIPSARATAKPTVDGSGMVWIFGGNGKDSAGNSGYLSDLWRYNPGTGEWTWISGNNTRNQTGVYGTQGTPASGNKPGGRDNHLVWLMNGYLWVFGGNGYDNASGPSLLNDLWRYNFGTGEWTWINGSNWAGDTGSYGAITVESGSNMIPARGAAVGWLDPNNNYWVFSGVGGTGHTNEMWRYNPANNQWTWMAGKQGGSWDYEDGSSVFGIQGTASTSNIPGERSWSCSWWDTTTKDMYIFGGIGWDGGDFNITNLNDTWKTH